MESSKPSEIFLLTNNNCHDREVTFLLQAAIHRVVTYFLRKKNPPLRRVLVTRDWENFFKLDFADLI